MTPVYAINLARSAARRESALAAYRTAGIDLKVHEAVDGAAQDMLAHPAYDRARRLEEYGEDLRSTEIACYLSHIGAMRRCLEEGAESAIIVEDDVHPTADFVAAVEALGKLPPEFSFVRLIGSRRRRMLPVGPLTPQVQLMWPTHGLCGAQGYYVTRPAMEKIVAAAEPILVPVDIMLDRYWRLDMPIFALSPFVVRDAEEAPSDIGGRPDAWAKRPRPWLRVKLRARKIAERWRRSAANAACRGRLPHWRALLAR
ncbi:MAG: glycosyltransferase family 25 protein [Hyphomonadaceae bacterium]